MRPSKDPMLLFFAKSALDVVWPEPSDELKRWHEGLIRGGMKLPKHVRQFPNSQKFIVGVSLAGQFRPLAYTATSLHAALLADCIMLRIDEFRKTGIASDEKIQQAVLNFPIEHALNALATNDSLAAWWSELLAYLLTEGILVERDGPEGFVRTGRPKTATLFEKVNERIEGLEQKVKHLEEQINVLLFQLVTKPIVIVGPSNPTTPTQPPIGWPLPAAPTSPI